MTHTRAARLPSTPRQIAVACALLLAFALPALPARAQNVVPKIVKKVPMDFPSEAVRRGVDRGVLRARVTVDGAGAVTAVAILDTQPAKAKLLNDTVSEGLSLWRFEGSGKAATFELQVVLTSE